MMNMDVAPSSLGTPTMARKSRIGQWCIDHYLAIAPKSLASKVFRRVLLYCIDALGRNERRTALYKFHGSLLELPLSHRLPIFTNACPTYQANLGRIAACICSRYPGMSIIDIGANVGDSVAVLRNVTDAPLLCIEGDALFFEILKRNAEQWQEVSLANTYVGFCEDPESRYASRSSAGTGHLVRAAPADQPVDICSLESILSKYRDIGSLCKLIKIDTDGFDTLILRSSMRFLDAQRPALFFEYDPSSLVANDSECFGLFESLARLGYNTAVVYDNLGNMITTIEQLQSPVLWDLHVYLEVGTIPYFDVLLLHIDDCELAGQIRRMEHSSCVR